MSSTSASRHHATDLPRAETEAGLAEWTSKIKAMQAQVDADEEAEQRRLEEEINASRLARLRRSQGGHNSRPDHDSTRRKGERREVQETARDSRPPADRHASHTDTVRKLAATSPAQGIAHAQKSPSPSLNKSESTSLAALMCSRATELKLNKHTSQPDAHDPSQFEQRKHVPAPHPVFGKGGIAMPGMTTKVTPSEIRSSIVGVQGVDKGHTRIHEKEDRLAIPPVVRRHSQQPQMQKALSLQHENGYGIRERRMSTPGSSTPAKPSTSPRFQDPPYYSNRPASQPSAPQNRSALLSQSQHVSATLDKASTPLPTIPPAQPFIPGQMPSSAVTVPPRTTDAEPHLLARPSPAEPKPSSQGRQLQSSQNPSTAFLRTAPQKDLTPSLSRLQGRGFVQSMIKISSHLEATVSASSTDNLTPSSGKKKNNVLERWQRLETSMMPSKPLASPFSASPAPMRTAKRTEAQAFLDSTNEPKILKPSKPNKLLGDPFPPPAPESQEPSIASGRRSPRRKSVSDAEALPQDVPPTAGTMSRPNTPFESNASSQARSQTHHEHSSGRQTPRRKSVSRSEDPSGGEKAILGSSQTLISYIKPTKTGDDPLTSRPPSVPPEPEIDEFGFRPNYAGSSQGPATSSRTRALVSSEKPAPHAKPLSHPTKDRARRPKKASANKEHGITKPGVVLNSAVSPQEATLHGQPTEIPVKQVWPMLPTDLPRRSPAAPFSNDSPSEPRVGGIDRDVSRVDSPRRVFPGSGPSGLVGALPLPGIVSSTPLLSNPGSRLSHPESSERRALPGLTTALLVPKSPVRHEERSPPSPGRHTRIPSTGNRATVMEVAEALNNHQPSPELPAITPRPMRTPPAQSEDGAVKTATLIATQRPRQMTAPAVQVERRKSSYEKYSAITLPPLLEEVTPVSSPAATLARCVSPALNAASLKVNTSKQGQAITTSNDINELCGRVEIDRFIAPMRSTFTQDASTLIISVDVVAVRGGITSAVGRDTNVFYDQEILAIVYRSKSTASGLVSTRVWGWRGKSSVGGEKEEQKLRDLARRYGTSLESVNQCQEPELLVHVLGGQLIIRQGARAHWSSDNTTMHAVRSKNGLVYIDEVELNIKNLCSGFSYCLSILGTMYVWHGIGAMEVERQAANAYANKLGDDSAKVVELQERDNKDEMFWMILGDESYAKADYWQWRPRTQCEPQILQVDNDGTDPVQIVTFLGSISPQRAVLILDCVWEFFVLVGRHARKRREDIRLALDVTMGLSKRVAESRPYPPNIHVLILPTQLPMDLRLHFRDLDEFLLNDRDPPDHMNLLSYGEALGYLAKDVWDVACTKDYMMFLLGLDPSDT